MLLKSVLLSVACYVFAMPACVAQSENFSGVRTLTKVSFLTPGVSYEKKINKFQTLYARAYLHASGYISASSAFGTSSKLYLDPALTFQYRHYYNAASRQSKGKSTDLNNLNYLAPVYKITFNAENSGRAVNRIGAVWGFQRNYQSRFSLDINVGLGYAFSRETVENGQLMYDRVSEFVTMGQLNLGFWLNKRV